MPADATAGSSPSVSDLQRRIDELAEELRARTADYQEALLREAAVDEVLRVVNSSSGGLTPVFDAMLERATALCEATIGVLWTYDGEHMHAAAVLGATPKYTDFLRAGPHPPSPVAHQALLRGLQVVHIPDVSAHEGYRSGIALPNALVDLGGVRTLLAVALRKDAKFLGVFAIYRDVVRPFSDRQIALLQNFAAQAAIAMENARLLGELRERTDELSESLKLQTATADVLKVISRSTFDLKSVLHTLVESAARLCEADKATITRLKDGAFYREEAYGFSAEFTDYVRELPVVPGRSDGTARALQEARTIHIADVQADPDFTFYEGQRLGGFRTVLAVPMLREGQPIGAMALTRSEVRPFTDKQIEMVSAFADQAVIAIENARLITETREALEQQTATAEVLEVINSSPGHVEPVFDAILEKSMVLCEAAFGLLNVYDGQRFHTAATRGVPAEFDEYRRTNPADYGPTTAPAQLVAGESYVHSVDAAAEEAYKSGDPNRRALVDLGRARTVLVMALRKDDALLGMVAIYRQEVRPFSDKQITLLQNFAAQAVIAMENARLIGETQEALERQTATAEVLEVINSSPGNLAPVFDAILDKAHRLCGVAYGSLQLYEGGRFRAVAVHGLAEAFAQVLRQGYSPGPNYPAERLVEGARFAHIADLAEIDDPVSRAAFELGGLRTTLFTPLRKDGALLGQIVAARREVRPFGEKEIALLESFAAQAAIALENARLITETREALERQTATAEVLQVINSSPGNLAPVFDAILDKAMILCGAAFGFLTAYDGERFSPAAMRGVPPALADYFAGGMDQPRPGDAHARVLEGEDILYILDQKDDEAYRSANPLRRAVVDLGGARSALVVALRKDGVLLGALTIYRKEVAAFSDKQATLLQGFAAQAVIAMENARLMTEQREALEQQTATAEVLQVINSSPGNLGPVFEAILEKAMHICGASFGGLWTFEAGRYVIAALHGVPKAYAEFLRATTVIPGPGSAPYRFLHGERSVIQNIDLAAEEAYRACDPQRRALVEVGGARSALQVPLCKEDTVIGVVTIYRQEVRAFNERQIALLQNFAAQAVVAMENARLFEELRERQAELRVTFDNMGDGVAMFDAEPRLAAWNRNFQQIIDLPEARLSERPSYAEYLRLLAERGEFGTENLEAELASRLENTERELRLERTRPDGTVIEVRRNAVPGGGFVLIYSDVTEQRRAEAEIRTARDAAEAALERQTATADILKVIASSPTDVEPVLAAVVKAAVRFCGATDAMIQLRDGDSVMSRAHEGPLTYNAGDRRSLDRSTAGGRATVDAGTCHLPDIEALDPAEFVTARRLAALHGFRAIVAAPLKREDTAIGAVVLRKVEPGPFTLQQIALLETFAAQAVIAIENVRLFTELRDSLERLKAAQANLIQSEKMASLGQLTAGIAHEIKNPLNFVNNFAGLSVELLDELKEVAEPVLAGMSNDARAEFGETIEMITSNLDKIAEHGKRADGIVKSMLSHSRGGTGDWQESNINALVEEALNLAYHGARAQDKEFNVTLERDFAPVTQPIELVPQDVTRVFLNLIGNGFYAANKRRLGGGEAGYRPTLKVSTRDLGEAVEITVRDNGIGIPPQVRAKLFQPFFTTKPTGEGTGLGLSISYDIVTQQHGGTIEVESEPGAFTEFTVRLPRRRRAGPARKT